MSEATLYVNNKPFARRTKEELVLAGGAIGIGAAIVTQLAVAAPSEVTTNVKSAEETAKALGGLATTALAVVLVPFAAMLTIKFLQMVMARV